MAAWAHPQCVVCKKKREKRVQVGGRADEQSPVDVAAVGVDVSFIFAISFI
jgi:hypothetical protein